MLFKQDELNSAIDEASRLLDNSSYLTESESVYDPTMVAIRENSRLGLNIIRLEDLVEYAQCNGISDAGYAIDSICEANQVDMYTLAFSIDEVSAIYDPEMADTALVFKENGAQVFAAPISSLNPVYQLTSAVTDNMLEMCGTEYEQAADSLLEDFINDNYDSVLSEAAIIDKMKTGAESVKNTVLNAASNVKKTAAEKLAALRKKLVEYKEKAKHLAGVATQKCLKAIEKIKQAIIYLKNKIASKVNK